jgi:hypothetical protein
MDVHLQLSLTFLKLIGLPLFLLAAIAFATKPEDPKHCDCFAEIMRWSVWGLFAVWLLAFLIRGLVV